MNYKKRRNIIIEQMYPIEEGVGAMVGALALISVLASVTGIAYDKLVKMSKEQIKKTAKKKNIDIPDFDFNTPGKIKPTFDFSKNQEPFYIVIDKEDVKTYDENFEKIKNDIVKQIKKMIPGIKLDVNTKKDMIDYTNGIEYRCSCDIFDFKKNITTIEKFAKNKGYDIDNEDEYIGEIMDCIEDEIIKKIKNFEYYGNGHYINKKGPILSLYDDVIEGDEFIINIELNMSVVVKK